MDKDVEFFTIRGKKIKAITEQINQADLLFYSENPRVYSILNKMGEEPTQEKIYKQMCEMDHVKTLKSSILSNGGILDPLLVKDNGDDTFTVLEGNSRLAAIRMICAMGNNIAKWAMVKCKVFPQTITEDEIYALLGQYHIIGRKDWDAYEKASYLYRRYIKTKLPVDYMAKELGITTSQADKMIKTIKFMEEHNDTDTKHYSYYSDVYLSSKSIAKYRDTYPQLDDRVVQMIKKEEVKDAKDLRKLNEISKGKDKLSKRTMQDFINNNLTLDRAYDRLKNSGKLDKCLARFRRFKDYINDDNVIQEIESSPEIQQESLFEIKKIITRLQNIKKKINEN